MFKPRIVNNVNSDVSILSIIRNNISIVRSVSTVSNVSIVCSRKNKECQHNKIITLNSKKGRFGLL